MIQVNLEILKAGFTRSPRKAHFIALVAPKEYKGTSATSSSDTTPPSLEAE